MRLSIKEMKRCVGCQSCMFACNRRQGLGGLGSSSISIRSAGGISKGFKVIICAACPNPPCAAACPTGALIPQKDGGVKLDPTKCVGCKNCVSACLVKAVFWDEDKNKPNICIHCGYCTSFCPYDVIEMTDNPRIIKDDNNE